MRLTHVRRSDSDSQPNSSDLNHAKHQKWQGLLGTEFFQLFPSENVVLHQGVVDLCVMVYDKLCHNNQNENEQGLCTFDQVLSRSYELYSVEHIYYTNSRDCANLILWLMLNDSIICKDS